MILTPLLRLLGALGRHGPVLLALAIFGGLLAPPAAHALRFVILPQVIGLMTLVLLRVDVPAAFAHLRRPFRLTGLVGFQLLVCPLLAWAIVMLLPLDRGLAAGVVLFATGCAATSSPAFARLVGLDPELTLLATLATTFLVPLTAPPLAYGLMRVDLAIGVGAFMARLLLVVGLPLIASVALRAVLGPELLRRLGPAVDGCIVGLLVLYGLAVMDGVTARIANDPAWVALATLTAFAASAGLNGATALAFGWMGRRAAATAGMMSGNRNMALYLAVLPAGADPRVGLFFALCQFPLFFSPFLLRPVYRRLVPAQPDA